MTTRRCCPPAPGPLEVYAQRFDSLFSSLAQRRGFRDYLQGLLLPRDRNKTLTGLAGAEPVAGAQHRQVQRLQWFLSESAWDHEVVNERRVQLLREDPATAPHDAGALVLDDTGDRKDATATAHVARQYLGSVGKIDNGIVAVTSLWADERCYWPVHAVPYTRPRGLRAGSGIPRSRPSRSWPLSWSGPPSRQGSHSRPWWLTASTATTPASPRPDRGQHPVRVGAQASQGHLGARRGGPHPGRGRWRAWLAQPWFARAVAASDAPLPRRPHRDLVGG